VISLVTDIAPSISVLEVKFIELFKKSKPKTKFIFEDDSNLLTESAITDKEDNEA
jgi:hypothetical protein